MLNAQEIIAPRCKLDALICCIIELVQEVQPSFGIGLTCLRIDAAQRPVNRQHASTAESNAAHCPQQLLGVQADDCPD